MNKINQLIQTWPKGAIRASKELQKLGYSPQILKIYSNSGWISLFSRGAYKLSNDDVDWKSGLYGIQRDKKTSFHIGGKTALEYMGILKEPLWNSKIDLFGNVFDKLPAWFTKQYWMKNINAVKTDFIKYKSPESFTVFNAGNFELEISSPELAVLELLFLVPKYYSLEETDEIIGSLSNLKPELLQSLLERCESVKVKRVFLFLAEKHKHSWFEELNPGRIFLGIGKRSIIKGGKFDSKYNITVPKEIS